MCMFACTCDIWCVYSCDCHLRGYSIRGQETLLWKHNDVGIPFNKEECEVIIKTSDGANYEILNDFSCKVLQSLSGDIGSGSLKPIPPPPQCFASYYCFGIASYCFV